MGVYAPMAQMGFFAADGGLSRSPNTVRGAEGKVRVQLTSLSGSACVHTALDQYCAAGLSA